MKHLLKTLLAEWFEEAIVETCLSQFLLDASIVGGHGNHFHVVVVDVLDQVLAAHLRHLDVHQHDGRLLVVQKGEGIGHVVAGEDLPRVAR